LNEAVQLLDNLGKNCALDIVLEEGEEADSDDDSVEEQTTKRHKSSENGDVIAKHHNKYFDVTDQEGLDEDIKEAPHKKDAASRVKICRDEETGRYDRTRSMKKRWKLIVVFIKCYIVKFYKPNRVNIMMNIKCC